MLWLFSSDVLLWDALEREVLLAALTPWLMLRLIFWLAETETLACVDCLAELELLVETEVLAAVDKEALSELLNRVDSRAEADSLAESLELVRVETLA